MLSLGASVTAIRSWNNNKVANVANRMAIDPAMYVLRLKLEIGLLKSGKELLIKKQTYLQFQWCSGFYNYYNFIAFLKTWSGATRF